MKRVFRWLALILATGHLPGGILAATNPALPPCSKFPSGRIHIHPWAATLANGIMSAPLPNNKDTYYYLDFVAAEQDVEIDPSAEGFSVIIPRSLAGAYEYSLHLLGRAEHANGRYYFTGVYKVHVGAADASATRRDTLEIVLSGRFCFDSSR